ILTQPNPPEVWAILDEAALHRQVGGNRVMKAQLARINELARLKHVHFQVLPFSSGAYNGMSSAFTILDVGTYGEAQVVSTASLKATSYHEGPEEIAFYNETFAQLKSVALPESDSQALVERLVSDV